MAVLTNTQRRDLKEALARIFIGSSGEEQLRQFLSDEMGLDLGHYVPSSLLFPLKLGQLIERLDGEGKIHLFLNALKKQFPHATGPWFTTADPSSLTVNGAANLGDAAIGLEAAIEALRPMRDDPHVNLLLSNAARPLRDGTHEIKRLTTYKALHDGLHVLQFRLEALGLAARSLVSGDANTATELTRYAEDLLRASQNALADIAGLPNESEREQEELWATKLGAQAKALLRAARALDPGAAVLVFEAAGSLQRQTAPAINRLMVEIAGKLQLQMVASALRILAGKMRESGVAGAARAVEAPAEPLDRLAAKLAMLVEAHSRWQLVDKDLAEVVGVEGRLRRRIRELASQDAGNAWASAVQATLESWEQAELLEDAPRAANHFGKLRSACRTQFFEVDKSLLAFCDDLKALIDPLQRLQDLAQP